MKDLSKVVEASAQCGFNDMFLVSDGTQEVNCNVAGLMAFVREFNPLFYMNGSNFTNLEYIGKDMALYREALFQLSEYKISSAVEVVDLLRVARAISHNTWVLLFAEFKWKLINKSFAKIHITTIGSYGLNSVLEHCSISKQSGSDIFLVSEKVSRANSETERVKWFAVDWLDKNNRLLFFDKIYNWRREKNFYLADARPEYYEETLFKMLFMRK